MKRATGVLMGLAWGLSVWVGVVWAGDELPVARSVTMPEDRPWRLKVDGEPVFIYAGEFFYFNCPMNLWRERFRKIKEAGFNGVETVVPWSLHERLAPSSKEDLSGVDLQALTEWLHIAHDEFGLYTIIRPGPDLGKELIGGGFPSWLRVNKPVGFPSSSNWLGSADPSYVEWSKRWVKVLSEAVRDSQVTRRPSGSQGGLILMLLNEAAGGAALAEVVRENGIKIPVIVGGKGGLVRDFQMGEVMKGIVSGETLIRISDLCGEAGPMDDMTEMVTHSRSFTTSSALIHGSGGIGKSYSEAKAIGNFLQLHGMDLSRSEPVSIIVSGNGNAAVNVRRSSSGVWLVFVGNSSDKWNAEGELKLSPEGKELSIPYKVYPGQTAVYCFKLNAASEPTGEWYPKFSKVNLGNGPVPSPIRIAEAHRMHDYPMAANWVEWQSGKSMDALGLTGNGLGFYGGLVKLSQAEASQMKRLWVKLFREGTVQALVNGQRLKMTGKEAGKVWFDLPNDLLDADERMNEIYLSYDGDGDGERGTLRQVDALSGINAAYLSPTGEEFAAFKASEVKELGLSFAQELPGMSERWWDPSTNHQGWIATELEVVKEVLAERVSGTPEVLPPNSIAMWYRVDFKLPEPSNNIWFPWKALIRASGNGMIWLNGHQLRKYQEGGKGREIYLPECYLEYGNDRKNSLIFCLSPNNGEVKLEAVEIRAYESFGEAIKVESHVEKKKDKIPSVFTEDK